MMQLASMHADRVRTERGLHLLGILAAGLGLCLIDIIGRASIHTSE